MTVTITYRCDKCSAEQHTPEQFWIIQVYVQPLQGSHHSANKNAEQQWCRKCVESVHLLPQRQHKDPPVELPEPPTFEELLREIVREEIAEAAAS